MPFQMVSSWGEGRSLTPTPYQTGECTKCLDWPMKPAAEVALLLAVKQGNALLPFLVFSVLTSSQKAQTWGPTETFWLASGKEVPKTTIQSLVLAQCCHKLSMAGTSGGMGCGTVQGEAEWQEMGMPMSGLAWQWGLELGSGTWASS